MKLAAFKQLVRVWKARTHEARVNLDVRAEAIYRRAVDELSVVLDGGAPPEEPAVVNVRVGGEITRAELEAYASVWLAPAMTALERVGIVVSLVAAPARDPLDGKAIVTTSTYDVEQMRQMFEQAAARLRQGAHFTLEKS